MYWPERRVAKYLTSLPVLAVLSSVMFAALPPFPGALVAPLVLLAWVGLAAALCASWPHLRRALFPASDPRWALPALAAITITAVAVRFLFCPGLPMVNSYGGLTRVVDAYAIASLDWSAQFQSIYPLGVTSLAGALMAVVGKEPGVYFSLVSMLAALLAPAVYGVGRLLWGRPHEALIAAAIAAVYPPLLAFSGSACLTVPYATLATLSLALLLLWLRNAGVALLCALGFALLLTFQTRPEAVVFALPVLAAAALARRRPWKELLTGPSLSVATLMVLFALPFLVTQSGHYFAGSPGEGAPGWQAALKWIVRGGLAVSFLYWWGVRQEKKGEARRFTAAGVLILAFFLILEHQHGLHVLAGGGYPFRGFPETDTYAPVEILFFNPKLTPLALTLAYFAAVALLPLKKERRIWLLLHVWLVPVFAAGFLKRGGEVPFFGVRTTLSAAPAFLLVAARGLTALWERLAGGTPAGSSPQAPSLQAPSRRRWPALVGVAIAVLTFFFPFFAGLDRTHNQQQEFLHLQAALSGIPDGSAVLYPADVGEATVEGTREQLPVRFSRCFRTRTLFAAALGEREGKVQYLPLAPDGPLPDLPDDQPVYFFQGLLCYRTGGSQLTPACRRALDKLPLKEQKRATISNRMYVADYFDDFRIMRDDLPLVLHELSE